MKKKRFLFIALLCAAVQGAWAQGVSYIECAWDSNNKEVTSTEKTCDTYTTLNGNSGNAVNLAAGTWYVVSGTNITYGSLQVQGTASSPTRIILCDGAKLTAQITVKSGNALEIYAQTNGSGQIEAKGRTIYTNGNEYYQAAAIGSDNVTTDMGKLTIHGGTINATSEEYAAAIGGSGQRFDKSQSNGGNVTIYAGTVTATCNEYGAGIGGGYGDRHGTLWCIGGNGGTLTIYGGTVTARGGAYAAGIGGARHGSGGTVTIWGGTVKAYGGTDAAGVGSGEEASSRNIDGGTLTVHGGDLFADGTGWGAGIGGGEDADGAKVTIDGGTVVAWAGSDAAGKNGCAIGSENGDDHRGTLTIDAKMMVHAGQNPTDADAHIFPYNTRVPACFFRPYAKIEVCTHPAGLTYTVNSDGTHTTHCKHCLTSVKALHFDNGGTGYCVCGYKEGEGVWTITLAKPDVDANGNFGNSYTGLDNVVAKGEAFTLPECDIIPNGYTFKGWVVGSESNGLEASEGATFLQPGDDYTPTASVTIKAHYEPLIISIADNSDNSETLYMNNGRIAYSVTLTGRTLYKDGKWNTLILPFDVTIANSPLAGADVRTLSSSAFNEETGKLTLTFTTATEIKAGKPYIIKWASGTDIDDPVFNSVKINPVNNPVTTDYVEFCGTYSPKNIYQTDYKTNLYLGSDNKLWYPTETTFNVNSCRAYFQLKGIEAAGEPDKLIKSFVLNFGDESTAVEMVNGQMVNGQSDWYDLQGRKVEKPGKGLYIVNGKKVIIK